MKYRNDSPMKNISNSEFITFVLELPDEKVDAGLMYECFSRLVGLESQRFYFHQALHFVIDCVEDKSRLDGLDIVELCVIAGADGKARDNSESNPELELDECEPFLRSCGAYDEDYED